MSIEQRHTEIQEGAGLTESRLNREFVDALRKWSTPVLLAICIVALSYVGWDWYRKDRDRRLDAAWLDLEKALQSRSPETLLAIADDHASEDGIPLIARAEAADVLLESALAGVRPGTGFKADGSLENPEDLLSAEQKTRQLERAADLYSRVIDGSKKPELIVHRIRAHFGLAAIAETRGDWDAAKRHYEAIIAASTGAWGGDLGIASAARKMLDTIDDAKSAPRLYADSSIVTRPAVPPPPPTTTITPPAGLITPVNPTSPPNPDGTTPAMPLDPADISPTRLPPADPKPVDPKPDQKPADPPKPGEE